MNHTARFITSLLWLVLSQYTIAQDYPLHSPVPADGEEGVELSVYASCQGWSFGDLFEIRLSEHADMSGYRSWRVSNRPDPCFTNLKEGTTYYWRVYVYSTSDFDFVPQSPVWHFTTKGTPPAGDCDLSDVPTSSDYYAATFFLCERSVLNGSKEEGKTNVEGVLKRSHLAKIAFRGVYLLNNREIPATVASDYYPTVYEDIATKTTDNEYYYQAARALLYLEYGDGVSPFDRNRLNFVPDDVISRLHTLKVLMETFNIRPDLNGSDNPFPNDEKVVALAANDPVKMGYIRRAAALGIITTNNAEFRPYDDCKRGEAFVMLARIMQKVEAGEFDDPNPQTADYFEPLNTTLATISLGLGIQMGNFNHYTKTSFALNGVVPLAFAHTYNSYNTTLPSVFFGDKSKTEEDDSYQPLGDGWSHNYHSFITVVGDYQNNVEDNGLRVIVHWGGGGIHVYKSNGTKLVPESMGIYDEMIYDGGNELTIKSKSQVEYLFSKQGGSGAAVFYLTSITDRNGNTLTINYEDGLNGSKRISSVIDGQRSLDFSYLSGTDLLSEVKDPLNRSIKFEYFDNKQTGKKQLKSFTDAEGNTTTYEYVDLTKAGTSKLLARIQLPKGNYIENEYDANSRLKNTVSGVSGVPTTKTSVNVQANYGSGSVSTQSQVDVERGSQTSSYNYTYNKNNVATSVTGAEGLFVNGTYGIEEYPELPTALQSNKTNISNISYDAKGNVTSITVNGDGTLTTSMTYDEMNNLTSITDPKGNITTYSYDTKGNLINVSAPEEVTKSFTVDSKGLITEMTNAMGVKTQFDYNEFGNVVKLTLPALGLSSAAVYDVASRQTSVTDALGRTSSFVYNNNDFLTSETDPMGHVTHYAYDKNDNLTSITNAKGGVTSLSYDNATDWLTSVSFAGATKEYKYNSDGTLAAYTKPDGTRLESVYDQLGRITNDGVNSYTYDNKMHLSSVSDGSSTLTFDYDGFNRLSNVKYSGNGSNSVKYYYDNNNNVTEVSYPNGSRVSYTYDGLNRMKSVEWNMVCSDGSKTGGGITYTYRKDSKLDRVEYPNGMTTEYGYDAIGRLTSKTTKLSNGTVVAGYTYILDKVGNIMEQTTQEPYNLVVLPDEEVSYNYNDGNRITKAGDISFEFDANGNTTKRGDETYNWDKQDRLTAAGSTSITYDPLGLIASYGDISFTTDPLGMGNVLSDSKSGAEYIYGNGLEARVKDGKVSYYVTDVRGSVVAIVDRDGNITHKYQYDDFGKVVQKEEADYNPFQYVGKYGVMYLSDNLYYMRARHYDPTIGRFLSEDPIWSTNLYPYTDNNPIMRIDFNGAAATPLETGRPGPNTPSGNTGGGKNDPTSGIKDQYRKLICDVLKIGDDCKSKPTPRESPISTGEWDEAYREQQRIVEELRNRLLAMGAAAAELGATIKEYATEAAQKVTVAGVSAYYYTLSKVQQITVADVTKTIVAVVVIGGITYLVVQTGGAAAPAYELLPALAII
jgi:RHS repeat-associated protein